MTDVDYYDGCSFAFVASQIVKKSESHILCVRDGYKLSVYKSLAELPSRLSCAYRITREKEGTQYHWRSEEDKSEYVFFEKRVNDFLKQKEKDEMVKVFVLNAKRTPKLRVATQFKT